MLTKLFSYRKFWAQRFGIAPVLPMSREEMDRLGWDSCDIILVTGDAYVDHPSFGMAIIGRLLHAQGFRVGIISQPNWRSVDAFRVLGKPNLFFGVTAGNMDSMVNHYTADRKIRSDDAYTPHGVAGMRPNRATIVYAQRCREAYKEIPIVIGGMEASLRRIAHYDYWSDLVKPSILLDSKADILLYGNAERAIVELAHRLAKKAPVSSITDLRGSAFLQKHSAIIAPDVVRLPSFSEVKNNLQLYAKASRMLHLETNPENARALVQQHADRDVWINPPPIPLTTEELDGVYDLPYSRLPHPSYGHVINIPAYEMIRFSVSIMRGCFGGCTFCSLSAHEGRIVQNRSPESILREIETIRDTTPGFTGIISDLGGPTANMYNLQCQNKTCQKACRKFSCLYPEICGNMSTNHSRLVDLYRKARHLTKIKKVLIGSGVRYDLAVKAPEYVKELTQHHVGGYLKIAPEHICPGPLSKMLKPDLSSYQCFKELFNKYSKEVGKEQYLIPYFIAAHPGTTDEDMIELALWLKENRYRLDQVQTFLPTPMTLATTMYHTGLNPLVPLEPNSAPVFIPKKVRTRKLHKALLRYHDPANWSFLRQELRRMGRADLIGRGKHCLVSTGGNFNRAVKFGPTT